MAPGIGFRVFPYHHELVESWKINAVGHLSKVEQKVKTKKLTGGSC